MTYYAVWNSSVKAYEQVARITHNGRVVRDLLNHQDRLATTVSVWPGAVEQLAQDWVEWLVRQYGCTSTVHTDRDPPSSPIPSFHFVSTDFESACRRSIRMNG